MYVFFPICSNTCVIQLQIQITTFLPKIIKNSSKESKNLRHHKENALNEINQTRRPHLFTFVSYAYFNLHNPHSS